MKSKVKCPITLSLSGMRSCYLLWYIQNPFADTPVPVNLPKVSAHPTNKLYPVLQLVSSEKNRPKIINAFLYAFLLEDPIMPGGNLY